MNALLLHSGKDHKQLIFVYPMLEAAWIQLKVHQSHGSAPSLLGNLGQITLEPQFLYWLKGV